MFNWAEACETQLKRTILQLQRNNYGGCLFAVRLLFILLRTPYSAVMRVRLQITSFVVAALYSGMWWWRWARAGAGSRMWSRFGWFSGSVCIGSVAGAVAWGANMQANALYYEAKIASTSPAQQQYYALYGLSKVWYTAFPIMYGVEFLCLIIPKLMLLGRLADGATRSLQAHIAGAKNFRPFWISGRSLPMMYKLIASSVIMLSLVSMVSYLVAGAYYNLSSGRLAQAAAACDAQGFNTTMSQSLFNEGIVFDTNANTAQAIQNASEAVTLLLISFSYVVLVSWSVAIFRIVERVAAHALADAAAHTGHDRIDARTEMAVAIVDDTMRAAAEQRRRLVAACIIVLITFPARAVFDVLHAYSAFNDPSICSDVCGVCQTDRRLIHEWLNYTPEFQPIVVALSSPLPLTISLWLVSTAHARARAIAGGDITPSDPTAAHRAVT